MQKRAFIIFLGFIGVAFPFEIFGTSPYPASTGKSLQEYYNSEIRIELSKSIFIKNGKVKSGFYKQDFIRNPNTDFFNNTSINTNPIPGEGTPKTAIFCRFENKLWQTFGIGVRLRVENVVVDH